MADQVDPYVDLPRAVVTELQGFAKTASQITIAIAIGIFLPAVFVFVFAIGVIKAVQSARVVRQFPDIKSPRNAFPGKSKKDLKAIALRHENLKAVLEFADARRAFWVAIVFPLVFIAAIVAVIALVA